MTARITACLLILALHVAIAHQDPLGDLYPLVKVENDSFAIYFYNNAQPQKGDYDMSGNHPVYRMVYSPMGELLGPRVPCTDLRSDSIAHASSMVYNKEIALTGEKIYFDADLLKAKPSYFVEKNGRRQHRRLPWPDNVTINYVASVAVDEKSLLLSATAEEGVLKLFHFDRNKFEPPSIAAIGEPAFIYNFPRASNVVLAKDRYWIAWIRYNRQKGKHETILSDWRPGEEKPHETILDAPSDWNTEISMAAIGNRLCIAYHCSVTGEYPGYSQIITVFRSVTEKRP